MLIKRKTILLLAAGIIFVISVSLAGCTKQPPQPPTAPAVPNSNSANICTQTKTAANVTISTSCSAQFTITAVNPDDKNSGNQRSVTSGFSAIVGNPQ